MRDILTDLNDQMSDPNPVKRAQINMKTPLPKRFYKEVTVGGEGEQWSILLDGRTVKTPAKQTLELPVEAVARLVADEWQAQETLIDPRKMPLTRLVNTALDGISADPQAVHEDILRFSSTDLLCYRADSPQELVTLQGEKWDPVMDWAANVLGASFILAEGIMHQEQPREAVAAFAVTLRKYDHVIDLASLHTITTITGSAILALAFAEGFLSADDVWDLAHVDENWQIGQWGEDEEAALRMKKRKFELDAAARLFTAMRDK